MEERQARMVSFVSFLVEESSLKSKLGKLKPILLRY